ncbi:acetyltransferase domain-containing protein [Xylaria sp. FL0933]|nr:acetyltransferase domain-containing protein [Xylaria sp. FL0933]
MASSPSPNTSTITVLTTLPLPLPPPTSRPPLHTPRLLLRPFHPSDLPAYHALRAQRAFMCESRLGVPDASLAETRAALDELTDPARENFMYAVFLLSDDDTDADTGGERELIGDCGVHTVRFSGMGWPEIGYKLAPAHWGRGYATEAMRAVLEAWWGLPRGTGTGEGEEVVVKVLAGTLGTASPTSMISKTTTETVKEPTSASTTTTAADEVEGDRKEGEGSRVERERVVAEIATYNKGSQRVLEKLGFEHFGTWEEPDTQLHRLGQPLEMGHYVLASPS